MNDFSEKYQNIREYIISFTKTTKNFKEKSISEKHCSIMEFLKLVQPVLPTDIDINNEELQKAITNEFLFVVEEPKTFEKKGYIPWINQIRGKIQWNFYQRYEEYLLRVKKWDWATVLSINESSDIILDHMKNPLTENFFDVKGLVMGDIQSGKTANYTALINKSIDAGYKLIIILAGLTKELRSQTQKRLDKEVLGYQTMENYRKGDSIGVGELRQYHINCSTCADDTGDLKKVTNSIQLSDSMVPQIMIVKKNSTVLKHLHKFLISSQKNCYTNDKLDIPVLIIDDEVDQASVNTRNKRKIEEASRINSLIRKITNSLNRYAYVGYTATPFANVFIAPTSNCKENEKDLFPEDFIICLPTPKDYCGVKEYFGVIPDDDDDLEEPKEELFVPITDYHDFFAKNIIKVSADTEIQSLPSSLKDAIMHFIISSAVKYSRGIVEHNSMLIHIARVKRPSTTLREFVKNEIGNMYKEYVYGSKEYKNKYKDFWEANIKNKSLMVQTRLNTYFNDQWDMIEKHISTILKMTLSGIKVLNGDSDDILDYYSSTSGQHLVIGGDKLSRGLTLEGLIVSYYYRNTKTLDTLMQMGRWFGYKLGWLDLCRVYSTNSVLMDFIRAGLTIEEFKRDIKEMNSLLLTPIEFGMKVRYSPKLAPTSHQKMRSAIIQKISFSGTIQQILTYAHESIAHNLQITNEFINSLPLVSKQASGNIVIRNVSVIKILDYLNKYKESTDTGYRISMQNWIRYIVQLSTQNEMRNWTVVINSNNRYNEERTSQIGPYKIIKSVRTDRRIDLKDNATNHSKYLLKVISNPTDFRDFLEPEDPLYMDIKSYAPYDDKIREKFTSNDGLLSIYCMDLHYKYRDNNGKMIRGEQIPNATNIIGLAIWFPVSKKYEHSAVEYYVSESFREKQEIEFDEEDDPIVE